MYGKILCLATSLIAAPAFAGSCTGEYTIQNGTANVAEFGSGNKVTFFTSTSTVSSTDTPYNDNGGCAGYVHEQQGKAWVSSTCTFATADGDSWGYAGSQEVGSQ